MAILRLALKSLWNRRSTALLTFVAMTLSVALLLAVDRVRSDAHTSFANTISQTDLIVGARSGSMQLLLYSVFRMGSPTNNITWESYQDIAAHDAVDWTVPLMLGDAHRGYPVLGTTIDYFDHYRYADAEPLALAEGARFDALYEAVLGAQVADELNHGVGDEIIISHGGGTISFRDHDDKPFTVAGILEPTGTPVDRTVHIALEGFEALHADWRGGGPMPGRTADADEAREMDLTPSTITSALVGLHSRMDTFQVQRYVNTYRDEPLLAILPGVALQELWDLMAVAERALLAVSAFVVLVGLIGMTTALLAGLNERRREMAILRANG
ncbi:MAG: ABC transporter permease, partial [Pseudomonadota bacterium]